MKTVCSFCKTVISSGSVPDEPVSHGVCTSCYNHIRASYGLDVRKFLDLLEVPVFLVDNDVNILAANTLAIAVINKPVKQVLGKLCGNVLDCINACLPEGCGKTEFCPECTIRETVTETYKTGHPVTGRPAVFRRRKSDKEEILKLLVSARKDGDIVLLRLEPAEPD
jgi:hypothetical protein